MFFISKGICTVTVRGMASKDAVEVRKLKEGDHFGEIHLLYKCARSASVISTNYITLARLKLDNFKDLISEFPEYEVCLKEHVIRTYGRMEKTEEKDKSGNRMITKPDPKIYFLKHTIKRVDYLKSIDDEVFFDIMFALKSKQFEKDEMVLAEDNNADSLLFIEEGCLEVYTHFEANEFIIERLYRGSALNHRAYFMKDNMYVNIRCSKEAKVLELSLESMKEIIARHAEKKFSNEMLYFQNRILKQERKFPLDYIMKVPRTIGAVSEDMASRENSLKNVVMNIIIQIRERKKRPKLSDFMAVYKTKRDEPNAKELFQKKFRMLYSGEPIDNNQEDEKYNKLTETFQRIQKQLSQQQQALSNLVKRVNNLSDKRDKREEKKRKEKLGYSGPDQDIKLKPPIKASRPKQEPKPKTKKSEVSITALSV